MGASNREISVGNVLKIVVAETIVLVSAVACGAGIEWGAGTATPSKKLETPTSGLVVPPSVTMPPTRQVSPTATMIPTLRPTDRPTSTREIPTMSPTPEVFVPRGILFFGSSSVVDYKRYVLGDKNENPDICPGIAVSAWGVGGETLAQTADRLEVNRGSLKNYNVFVLYSGQNDARNERNREKMISDKELAIKIGTMKTSFERVMTTLWENLPKDRRVVVMTNWDVTEDDHSGSAKRVRDVWNAFLLDPANQAAYGYLAFDTRPYVDSSCLVDGLHLKPPAMKSLNEALMQFLEKTVNLVRRQTVTPSVK